MRITADHPAADKDAELASLREVVAELDWRFAKSMPHIPHSYIVRGRTVPEEVYVGLFRAIRTWGVDQRFGPYRGRYLHLGDGRKCWAMTASERASRIINRDQSSTRRRAGCPNRVTAPSSATDRVR